MRYVSSLLCVVSVCALVACSKSNQNTPQTASACSGDPYLMKYNCSIDRVQAAAENGDADAEYALGYMYYYGVNTARDQDSATLWISRSAAQGQPLAKSALAMLQGKNAAKTQTPVQAQAAPAAQVALQNRAPRAAAPNAAHTKITTAMAAKESDEPVLAAHKPQAGASVGKEAAEDTLKTVSQDAASAPPSVAQASQAVEPSQAVQTPQAAAGAPHAVEASHAALGTSHTAAQASQAVETDDVAQMEGRLMHVANDGYTLQLMGNRNEAVIKDFVTNHHLENQAAYYYSSFDNAKWYMLVYGQYKTVHQAHEAIAKLPPELRQLQPWIKPNKDIKAEIESRHLTS